MVVSHTFPCSGYINQAEPTLTHQIPSPPTTTIPSSGTSGLGPCPRVPGACSRCWDDEGSQIASSCASIPGKFLLQHSSSSSILTQRFTGRRRVDAASGLQGLGTVDDGAPSSLQLPSGPPCGICLFNVLGSVWQRLAIWSGAVRRVGVIAEMGRARERDAGTHRGGTPALAPTEPLCDAGGLTAFPYFFLCSSWGCRYGLISQCILDE